MRSKLTNSVEQVPSPPNPPSAGPTAHLRGPKQTIPFALTNPCPIPRKIPNELKLQIGSVRSKTRNPTSQIPLEFGFVGPKIPHLPPENNPLLRKQPRSHPQNQH